ncbi:MAG: hypothetical protein ACKPKO_39535, partial [Candidatus Fonsibacter sp.]
MANPTNTSKYPPARIYGDAGLIYSRYHEQIESKPNGPKKIGVSRPSFSNITKQIDYASQSGDEYSLLMGREFKLGPWSVLLDFDNKADETSHSVIYLINKLNMDQDDAPKQKTPSGGVTSTPRIRNISLSNSTTTYQGVKYNLDVKL